jgi:L-2-hydroxyglutarate oxidase LhgO
VSKDAAFDYLIVGSGILGLSIGIRILRNNPKFRVAVVEKEGIPGSHASTRNSGVLHAGLYYEPNSLKARFTKAGNASLKKYIRHNDLPLLETGKILVAKNDEELLRLERLIFLAKNSGTRISLLDENLLETIEPLAKTYKKFLWSPDTCIGSPELVLQSLVSDFQKLGGKLLLNSEVTIVGNCKVEINENQTIKYSVLINCAGTGALSLAKMDGMGEKYKLLPVLGSYLSSDLKKLPLSTLVYSVPHPLSPFLGVHFTQSTDGKIKIGPTAIPLLNREQYTIKTRLKMSELIESLGSLSLLLTRDPIYASKVLANQLANGTARGMIKKSIELVPDAAKVGTWKREPAGIRAQLLDSRNGKMVNDFIVERNSSSVHILNAVSPGWTSAFPFADYVLENFLGLSSNEA